MELGSIWLGGFRLGVLDWPPGTPEPKELTKPIAALLRRAGREETNIEIIEIAPDRGPTHWPNTHTAGSSCLRHFSAAGIQDSRAVCSFSNGRWSVWTRHNVPLREEKQKTVEKKVKRERTISANTWNQMGRETVTDWRRWMSNEAEIRGRKTRGRQRRETEKVIVWVSAKKLHPDGEKRRKDRNSARWRGKTKGENLRKK